MAEATFRQFLVVAQETYRPIFQRAGLGLLEVRPLWASPDVNAVAYPEDVRISPSSPVIRVRRVDIYGGLARHPLMTAEGLMLVVCHELGHHLGGFPRYSEPGSEWASTEGQSDYFATAKCAREVFGRLQDNEIWAQRAAIPLEVRTMCQANFARDRRQAAICMRSAVGGLSLARVLGSLGPARAPVDFRTPNRTVVPVTFEGHPEAQCRLDTYFAGALCQAPSQVPFSSVEPRQGACTPDQRFRSGFRPTCWFRPPGGSLARF